MTDKELLQYAAKAAGIDGHYASLDEFPDWMTVHDGEGIYYTASQAWNPLTDDGDAFRLVVKLRLSVTVFKAGEMLVEVVDTAKPDWIYRETSYDMYAATRRAITRAAAAEIGRAM